MKIVVDTNSAREGDSILDIDDKEIACESF
jgi:hypothetical protein